MAGLEGGEPLLIGAAIAGCDLHGRPVAGADASNVQAHVAEDSELLTRRARPKLHRATITA